MGLTKSTATSKQWAAYIKSRVAYNREYRRARRLEPGYNKQQTANYRRRVIRKQEAAAGRPKPVICEVCGRTGRISWDHDHLTGKFRGWICHKCNVALGMVEDSPHILRELTAYLEKIHV